MKDIIELSEVDQNQNETTAAGTNNNNNSTSNNNNNDNNNDEVVAAWWDYSNDESGAARLLRSCEEAYGWDHDQAIEVLAGYRLFLQAYKEDNDCSGLVIRPIRQMWKIHASSTDEFASEWNMLAGKPFSLVGRGGGGRRRNCDGLVGGRGCGGRRHKKGGGRGGGRRHWKGHRGRGRRENDMEDYDDCDIPPCRGRGRGHRGFKKMWKGYFGSMMRRREDGMVTVRVEAKNGTHHVHCPSECRMRRVYRILGQELNLSPRSFYLVNSKDGQVVPRDMPLEYHDMEALLTISTTPVEENDTDATAVLCEDIEDLALDEGVVVGEEPFEEIKG